jgi:hypothetical protein
MNNELHLGLTIILSILYPLLVYITYRKEYDIQNPKHKRNKELHKTHNKPFTIRRGIEWPD